MPAAPLVIGPETSLRELALRVEGAWRVLGERHIDYAAASAKSLRDACASEGFDVARVIAELESERARTRVHGATRETCWSDHAPWELVEHLLDAHHPFTWRELERIGAAFDDVLREARSRELVELADLFASLRTDLEPHMRKEERVLFPWILSLRVHDAEGTTPPTPPFGHPRHPVRVMRGEHDAASEIMARMRHLTRRYTPPDTATPRWRALYEALDALDRDLVRHVSLENDVLFPMIAG
ncbi:hemerythrin domain-containing protein [Sandaracinus amylolyticus]|uniref:hemerythrin domain-containing protein n=1 Tax=Sandaracinus amylolyticus TaxID=927083 RepID=UPI001F2CA11B|nr:hemerythrin domain-containing protein [Sandaracinus amylolyticus]UJR81687.1 Hypothetical protein I5071_37470 [Sandaracinus amylolyticus]